MVPPSGTSKKPYAKSLLEYMIRGLPLGDFYGYGQAVRSPMAGVVVACENSIPERNPVNIVKDVAYAKKATRDLIDNNAPSTTITGNYVLIKGEGNVYVLLAHLRPGTVTVRIGQNIAQGETVGRLGHSGNSTMPHLHMQFMDSADYKVAHGIPFAFRDYDVKTKNGWRRVAEGLPTDSDIVRF
jgi:murein DD-endopeptidase MepM/ murein hydrolase activator NlpD